MALGSTAEQVSPRSHVDSQSTRLRVEILVGAGHSLADLARAIGKTAANLRCSLERRSVTVHTAAAVEALYECLAGEQRACGPAPSAIRPEEPRPANDDINLTGQLHESPPDNNQLLHRQRHREDAGGRRGALLGTSRSAGIRVMDIRRSPIRLRRSACRTFPGMALRLDQAMPYKPGPGRPSKGARDQFSVRPAVEVGEVLREKARAAGMYPAEYCAAVLCDAMGMPEYAPTPSLVDTDQPSLPLSKSA